MTKLDYLEYLKSDHWKKLRHNMIDYTKNHCVICGNTENLEVHHNTYQRIGCEMFSDLAVLCKECHSLFHARLASNFNDIHQPSILDQMKAELVSYLPDIEGKIRLTNVSDQGIVTAMAADTAIGATLSYHDEQCLALLKQKWPWITHIKLRIDNPHKKDSMAAGIRSAIMGFGKKTK